MTKPFSPMTDAARSAQPLVEDVHSVDQTGRLRRLLAADWLSDRSTADEELALLNEAAARIRSARIIAQHEVREAATPGSAALSDAGLWESVVAQAAKEASCTSAQLAHIGLDIGSVGLVRRAVADSGVKTLEMFFRDGQEVRRPGLLITGLRDGSIHYGWTGEEMAPGELDLSKELRPQLRRLILRLCDLVARGYDQRPGTRPPP